MKNKLSRREFLRGAVIAGAGLAAAACAPETPAATPAASTGGTKATAPAVRKPTTIQWMVWGGTDRYKPILEIYQKTYPEMASWLTVELVSPGSGEGDSYKALRLALAAGGEGLPDMCAFNYNGMPEFAEGGHLLDIGNMISSYKDQMITRAQSVAQYNGKFYAVPNQLKPKNWYYRKDMFSKAGIDPAAVKTFDDLVAAGKKFHQTFPDSFMWNMGQKPASYYYNEMLSHWDDVQIADKNGNYLFAKNPHYSDVFKWLKEMATDGLGFATDDFSTDWGPAFADNKIGSSLISSWMNGFLPKYAPKQKDLWGITVWPDFSNFGTDNGGQVQCMLAKGKNPEAAFEFASKMFLDTKGAVEYWKYNGTVPGMKAAQEEVKNLASTMTKPADYTDDQWATTPVNFFGKDFMAPIFKSMENIKVFPWDPKGVAEFGLLTQHHQAYIAGQETLEQALSGAEADMKAQLGNPYKL